jgi:hypothetical protein
VATHVEWTVLEGDQVETLLANLIYNHEERALRIRPAQGDQGLDIIIPATDDPRKWDVYQVKKFAANLTPGQKGQIEKSFRSVLVGMVRRGVALNDWYLTLPLDPTPENFLDWFEAMPEDQLKVLRTDTKLKLTDSEFKQIEDWLHAPGRVIDWKGLPFCENLAARFPYVVDYYLHGGRDRITAAVDSMAKLSDLDRKLDQLGPGEGSAALIQPREIQEHLAALSEALDTDPHYRYSVSLDAYEPQFRPEPKLVTAQFNKVAEDRWITTKIYARSAQSTEERPIPLKLTFEIESGSEEEWAFKEWLKFGKPFEGLTAKIDSDLPGGLGSGKTSGKVSFLPVEDGTPDRRLRQRIVDPDGKQLAEIALSVRSTSGPQGTGVRTYGSDSSGFLSIEWLLDPENQAVIFNYQYQPLEGSRPARLKQQSPSPATCVRRT